MTAPLWFYWGGDHLTFLRWMTLESAARFHDDVRLIRRAGRSSAHLSAGEAWIETQDFQRAGVGENWIDRIPPGVTVLNLDDIAPEIAAIDAPDVQTSDLLGWWLLSEHGGSVSDMDVIFLAGIPVITHDVQLVVCTGTPKPGYMPIGFIQGQPCDFWRWMYRRARERYDPRIYQSCGPPLLPPWEEIPGSKRLLPEAIVYPFALQGDWMQWHKWMFDSATWPAFPPESCGIHWYGGANQQYNRSLTPANVEVATGAVPWAIRSLSKARA